METEIAGNTYTVGSLNAIEQLNVARRLLVAFSGALPTLIELVLKVKSKKEVELTDEDGYAFIQPFADAAGKLSDNDFEYLAKTCVGCVKRKTGNVWGRLAPSGTLDFMFPDIKGMVLLTIIWKVVEANLSDFFPNPPATSSEAAQPVGQS